MRAPKVFDDFLPKSFHDELRAFVMSRPLTFGAKSNSKSDPHGHLAWQPIPEIGRHNLGDIGWMMPGIIENAWVMVRGKIVNSGPSTKLPRLIRCYANAYAYGMDGYFHVDSQRNDEITVILYICDQWDPDWAGETMMMEGGHYWAVLPAPNRALFLPSNMNHAARAVSRKCMSARMVLVFKCRPSRSTEFENLSQFLMENDAYKIEHHEGSLHDHLVRVYQLLADHGCDQQTCLGGGLHSVYGTNAFKRQLLKPDAHTRSMIAGRFGAQAGKLAYYFSILARPGCFENALLIRHGEEIIRAPVTSYGDKIEMPEEEFRQLALIECANLADQSSLYKWPDLKKLWTGSSSTK